MKKILLSAAIILAMVGPASATLPESLHKSCAYVGDTAEALMEARQRGVSITRIMEIVDGSTLHELIALEAWNEPRYSTASYQKRAIDEFRDFWVVYCYNLHFRD